MTPVYVEFAGGALDGERKFFPAGYEINIPVFRPLRVWLDAAYDQDAEVPLDRIRYRLTNRMSRGAHVYELVKD